jgi:hypoxia up-regulated 1
MAREFVSSMRTKAEELRYHTEEELEALLNATEKLEKWMTEKVSAQKKLAPTEDPVLLTSHVLEKTKAIEDHLMKLLTKKKPKVPKKAPEVPKNETENAAKEDTPKKEDDVPPPPPTESETPAAPSEGHEHDEL